MKSSNKKFLHFIAALMILVFHLWMPVTGTAIENYIIKVGYAIFKPANLQTTYDIFASMQDVADFNGMMILWHKLHRSFWPVVAISGLMFVVDIVHYSYNTVSIRYILRRLPLVCRWLIYVVALMMMIFFGLYGSGFNQFEYFKF